MSEPVTPTEIEHAESGPAPRSEPVFNLPPAVLGVIGICVFVHLIRVYVLTDDQDMALLVRAAFVPIRYSGQYDLDFYAFSSPFTYAFLHGGFAHLGINMLWLAAFGSPLANRMGSLRFALFFAVTSLASAGLFWVIHPLGQAPLVGASGAISGMMAAATRFGFNIDRSSGRAAFAGAPLALADVLRSRNVMYFLALWMVINLVTGYVGLAPGISGQIAWEAHIGGFLAGFFGLRLFDRRPAAPAA